MLFVATFAAQLLAVHDTLSLDVKCPNLDQALWQQQYLLHGAEQRQLRYIPKV